MTNAQLALERILTQIPPATEYATDGENGSPSFSEDVEVVRALCGASLTIPEVTRWLERMYREAYQDGRDESDEKKPDEATMLSNFKWSQIMCKFRASFEETQ